MIPSQKKQADVLFSNTKTYFHFDNNQEFQQRAKL